MKDLCKKKPDALHDPVHEVLPPVLTDLALQPVVEAPHQHLLNSLDMALDLMPYKVDFFTKPETCLRLQTPVAELRVACRCA